MIERSLDTVVIGGGAAGLAAAIAAKEEGLGSIVILERGETLGGILPQCIHTGFGLHYLNENLTGPEYVDRFVKRIHSLGIEFKLNTMALDLNSGREVLAVNQIDGAMMFKARTVVLATGCRERSRGAIGIPGTRPAGVLTAGAAQRLMDVEGYLPGKKVLILGSGDIGLIMARRFVMEGAEVKGVVEVMPYPGGLDRNLQCLRDFGIPLYLRHAVTFIHGNNRVEAATVSEIDRLGRPIGQGRIIDIDTLVVSVGLIPENELSKRAGVRLDPRTGGPRVDENLETSVPGVFACGNALHVHDLVDYVTSDGVNAGRSAARKVRGELPRLRNRIHLRPGRNVRYVVPQVISGEMPLTLYCRVKRPAYDIVVNIGKGFQARRRVTKPPETLALDLTRDGLRKFGDEKEVTVDVTRHGRRD
jgi:NADPH-dependent 2,4-dienoyl-CoA reductase/sulfur reductase-like enzyme